MSKPFYKYLVEELLLGFFKKNPQAAGNRYYLVIENEDYRKNVCEAIEAVSSEIVISNIYDNTLSEVREESYKTHLLHVSEGMPDIIVGYDQNATEDYLTTLRNAVGFAGAPYENYCLLYILRDSSLSSLITACQDLQLSGYPLSVEYIIDNIKKKAKKALPKKAELIYFEKHLERLFDSVAEGTCTLFDFEQALSILEEQQLSGRFNNLDFFPDERIYDPLFEFNSKDINDRVEQNQQCFRKVRDIMNTEDDVDKFSALNKFLDERLSRDILKSKDGWSTFDFQRAIDSMDRKAATDNLMLVDMALEEEGLLCSHICRTKGNVKKTSKNHLIICDRSSTDVLNLKLKFNKNIPKGKWGESCRVAGVNVKISVGQDYIKESFGLHDNHHDFNILRVFCSPYFFENIQNYFIINAKGEIVVEIPDDWTSVKFGRGERKIELSLDGKVQWDENTYLEIPTSGEEDEKIRFSVCFGEQEIRFLLKIKSAKPVPPIGPLGIDRNKLYRSVDGRDQHFEKITDGEVEYPVILDWRSFLQKEKSIIDARCSCIIIRKNGFSPEGRPDPIQLELPINVQIALMAIYDYYQQCNSVPSLTPFDDKLVGLYCTYLEAVVRAVDSISHEDCLTKEEYNLTKLGTVIDDVSKHVYFTPFHPIIVAYLLEYNAQFDTEADSSIARKLLSPFYLVPFLSCNDVHMRPVHVRKPDGLANWLCYEEATTIPQARTNDITARVVKERMLDFVKHFNYLFQDKECPIIISCIGIKDDSNVIKGIVEFIRHQYSKGVQRIELHEYVDNLMEETFFERLNRLGAFDAIVRAFSDIGTKLEVKEEYTEQEIIHQLFTRVSFYKHSLKDCNGSIIYSHIAFYMMDVGNKFIKHNSRLARTEMSLQGLISTPSTLNKNGNAYVIGFGNQNVSDADGYVYRVARAMNNLYANEENEGNSVFQKGTALAKHFSFVNSEL